MYEWKECRDTAHWNDRCGACGDSIGMDLIGCAHHWHVVADGHLATPYHSRCKPPERPESRPLRARMPGRILLVTLGLLAIATSASAECGWVLWSGFLGAELQWFTNTAYQTHGECLAGMELMVQLSRRAGADVTWAQGQPSATWRETTGARGVYQCLPDTVDPRGPRGKS